MIIEKCSLKVSTRQKTSIVGHELKLNELKTEFHESFHFYGSFHSMNHSISMGLSPVTVPISITVSIPVPISVIILLLAKLGRKSTHKIQQPSLSHNYQTTTTYRQSGFGSKKVLKHEEQRHLVQSTELLTIIIVW